jgi:Flp pilus assembly CpaF family ATPase
LSEAERLLDDRLYVLREYMQDPSVTEVMINSAEHVFVERGGKMSRVDVRMDDDAIESAIRAVMMLNEKETTQIMDARLSGLRIAAALPPVAVHGPMIVIRKHATHRIGLDDYVAAGSFDRVADLQQEDGSARTREVEAAAAAGGAGLAEFLRWAIRTRKNVLVAGGTGSGKTTLLSACLAEIPPDDRVITCEDTNELSLVTPNCVQFEAMPTRNIAIRDLIRLCLRSRPDRIIVGEIRGAEAFDFLDAMNTGHPGSLCTLHADSPEQALIRLESLMRMSPATANLPLRDMRAQIASAINYVVFQARVGGSRAPQKVLALDGLDDEGRYRTRLVFDRLNSSFKD